MEKLIIEVVFNVLIDWLQDNIDCGNMIIFDNDEDNIDLVVLLFWIECVCQDVCDFCYF